MNLHIGECSKLILEDLDHAGINFDGNHRFSHLRDISCHDADARTDLNHNIVLRNARRQGNLPDGIDIDQKGLS